MVKELIKSVKGVLFADPKLLYSEEKHLLNKEFYFEGTNGKAVLLIHGWTSTPYEVRRLGKYLNENGYTVYGPRLRGHGTKPQDLENVKWNDWLDDAGKSFDELKKKYRKIYVGGTSIGANLAVLLAKERPETAGLILMAMPYRIKLENTSLIVAKILRLFGKYKKKIYPPTFGLSTTITRLISYQKYPIDSALESFNIVKKSRECLEKINQPCLIMQSNSDHIVGWDSLEKIYKKISSEIKNKKYVSKAYHTFISDIKNEHVFEDILSFLNEN